MTVSIQDTAAVVTSASAVVAATIAVAALRIAKQQIQENKSLNAQDAYLQFHRFSFENPEFSKPKNSGIYRSKEDTIRYHWFVIHMLICIERIVIMFPSDESWRKAIKDDLNDHKNYICSKSFDQYLTNFSTEMQGIIAEFRSGECIRSDLSAGT